MDREVLSAQIEQCYRQLPISLAVNLVNALILIGVLSGAIDAHALIVWLLVIASITAARYLLLRAFRDARRRAKVRDDAWRRYFVLGACAAGLAWGSAGVLLFHPNSFTHQVFLAFVLGGMVAGGVPLLSSLDNAYQCFAIPVVLPISLQMLAIGDRVHLTMGLMILVFGVAMLASSAQVRRLFRESHDLRVKLLSSIEDSAALQQMLRLDDLTGIANRRLFEEQLEKEWQRAKRDNTVLSVVTADIDYFKAYNDHYGHPAGDRCLIRVARTMANVLHRPGDVAARIGGEEFAFLLPGTALKGAQHVAETIRSRVVALNLPHEAPSVLGSVTVSLGVACSAQASISSAADLLGASDAALYEAKRRGRNQVAMIEQEPVAHEPRSAWQ